MANRWTVRLGQKHRNGELETYILDIHGPGQRRRISLRTADPDKAAVMLADYRRTELAKMERAATEHVGNTPLAAVLDYYTETYLPVSGAAPRSITEAVRILREFELYCRSRHIGRAQQLSRAAVDGHARELQARGLSNKSVHKALGIVRAVLNAAVDAGLLDHSPIAKWLMPRCDDVEIDPLTPDQLRRVLEIISRREPQVADVVTWIAHTGNRPSDARALTWAQVDLETRTVQRPQVKTGRLATYQIGDAALEALLRARKRAATGLVFTGQGREPFGHNTVLRAFQRALRREGFERPVSLKDLRHTFGYIMANHAGCPLPVLQQLMGHSSIEMTMRYVRPGDAFNSLATFDKLLKTVAPQGTAQKHRYGS